MALRRCNRCDIEKSPSSFPRNGAYRRTVCKRCWAKASDEPKRRRPVTTGHTERGLRIETIEYLVCSLAKYGEDVVVRSCIRVLGDMNLHEISIVFGCSRERVRQIEEVALSKVRRRADLVPELKEAK